MPIVADAEAGFGGPLNAFELMKPMIAAGAAGVHWEDQLASEKKCGHMGGKVLIPDRAARPDAERRPAGRRHLGHRDLGHRPHRRAGRRPDHQRRRPDRPAVLHRRAHRRGLLPGRSGLEPVLARAKAYAPYADLIWVETGTPDLGLAREFATELHKEFPGKMLAYNCSPSFNWKPALDDAADRHVPGRAGRAGLPVPVHHPGRLPRAEPLDVPPGPGLRPDRHDAYVELQEAEFADEAAGYTAVKHQAEVGTGYFDKVATALNPRQRDPRAGRLHREEQFH